MEANENVIIYAPVIMNAEVICYNGDWADVKTVGISQGREREKTLAGKTYPQIEEFQEITQKGIWYTLEDGQVDAVIQDMTKAAQVPECSIRPVSENDYISYVLVVDREFAQTKAFSDFIKSYNNAVEKLNEPAYLAEKLGVDESWLEDKNIQFLTIEESEE